MKLITHCEILSSSLFSSATIYKDALILKGRDARILRGQNAHLSLPWMFFGLLPPNIMQASDSPKLLHDLDAPLQIKIESTSDFKEALLSELRPLDRPLTYTVPNRTIGGQWFSIESYNWAAVHEQKDFWFLTRCSSQHRFHLKFSSQAYALTYEESSLESLWADLCDNFPANPGNPNTEEEKHGFSVYSPGWPFTFKEYEASRFKRFTGIWPIDDKDLDVSEFGSMPPKFRKITAQKLEEFVAETNPVKTRTRRR